MSNVIDERVVSMQFDNRNFEHNAKASLNTLEKLKQSLNFTGATRGLEDVGSAVRNINLNPLSDAVESVKVKFSSLQIMAVTALQNITNKAVNTGERLVKSLSVDNIAAGWGKYEKKTASVQTIINATGKSIDEVNAYLNKLMWFSDETSYGFTDMTQALATMTSSGGDIDKLIPMIMGVANATAFAGKGAAEFSRIMQYGINQAYSLGHMQVRDWMSIESATVGSKQLIETLIRAGEELGKIEKGAITASSFRNSLADKWLDKDVMEKGFGAFSEMSEKAFEMVNSGEVDTASEAYEKLSEQYDTVSLTAAKAAQEAKTFTEALDATKDAVSSGWLKTFEIIFGNYEEAKKMWTGLANYLWDVFASGADSRNNMLEEVLRGGSVSKLAKKLKSITSLTKDTTDSMEDLSAVVEKVINGDYGNGQTRWDKLAEEGYDWAKVQNLVNKELGSTTEHIEQVVEAQGEQITQLENLSDAKLEELGLTEDEIKLYRELESAAKDCGMTMAEYLETNKEVDRRTKLLEAFKKIGEHIITIIEAMKEGWKRVFGSNMGDALAGIIDKFVEWVDSIELGAEAIESITSAVQGFCSAIQLGTILGSGLFGAINKIITIVQRATGLDVVTLLGKIGDAITNFKKMLIDDSILTTWLTDVGNSIAKVLDTALTELARFINNFKKLEFVQEFVQKFAGTVTHSLNLLLDWFTGFNDIFGKFLDDIGDINSLNLDTIITAVANLGRNILQHFGGLERVFAAPLEAIVDFGDALFEHFGLGNNVFTNAVAGIKKFCSWVSKALSGVIDWFEGIKDAEDAPRYVAEGIVAVFDWAVEAIKTLFSNLWKNITDAANGESNGLISGVASGLWTVVKFIGEVLIELGKIILERLGEALTPENLEKTVGGILSFIGELGTLISAWVSGALEGAGDNVVLGFIKGIWNGIQQVGSILFKLVNFVVETVCDLFNIQSPSRVFKWIGLMCIAGLVLGLTSGGKTSLGDALGGFIDIVNNSGLWEAIKTYFGKIVDFFKNLNIGTIVGVAGIGAIIYFATILYKAVDIIKSGIKSINGVLDAVAGVIKTFEKVEKAIANSFNASAVKQLSIAIAILVGAIVALTYVGMQEGAIPAMWNAVAVVGVVLVVVSALFAGLTILTNKIKANKSLVVNVAKVGALIASIGLAFALVAGSIFLLSRIGNDKGQFDRAIEGLKVIGVCIGALLATVLFMSRDINLVTKAGKPFSANMSSAVGTLLSIASAILALSTALLVLSWIDEDKFAVAVGALGAITVSLIFLMWATRNLTSSVAKETSGGSHFSRAGAHRDKTTKQIETVGKQIMAIASAILVVSLAVTLLSFIPADRIQQGGHALAQIAGLIALLMLATWGVTRSVSKHQGGIDGKRWRETTNSSNPLNNIAETIMGIAKAMMVVALAVALLSFIPEDKIRQGGIAIASIAAVMAGLMWATNLMVKNTVTEGKNKFQRPEKVTTTVENIGRTLMMVAGAIGIVALAVKMLSTDDHKAMAAGIVSLGIIAAVMAGLIAVVSKIAKQTVSVDGAGLESIGKTLIAVAGAMLLMSAAFMLLGNLGLDGIGKGILGTLGLAFSVLILLAGMKTIAGGDYTQLGELGKTIMAIAVAIGVLALASVVLSLCDFGSLMGGVAAIVILMTFMSGLIASTKNATQSIGPIIALTVAIAVMATAISLMAGLLGDDIDNALKAAAALSAVMLAMAGSMWIISKIDPAMVKKNWVTLLVMSVVISAIGAALTLLGLLPFNSVLESALALGVVMLALAGSMFIISQMKDVSRFTDTIIALAFLIGAIGAALTLLGLIPFNSVLQSALALGVVMLALAGSILIISNTTKMDKSMMGTILTLAAFVVAVGVALTLLANAEFENALQGAIALSVVMLALAGAVAIISNFGSGAGVVGTLLAMSVVLVALAGSLYALAQADPAKLGNALGILVGALVAITAVLVVLSIVFTTFAPGAAMLVGVLLAIAAVIGVVAVAAVAFGIAAKMFADAMLTVGLALPIITNGLAMLVNTVVDLSSKAWEFVGTAIILGVGLAVLAASIVPLSAGMLLVGVAALIFAAALLLVGPALTLVEIGLAGIGDGLQKMMESVADSSGLVEGFANTLLISGAAILIFLSMTSAGLLLLGAGATIGGAGLLVLGAGLVIVAVGLALGAAAVLLLAGTMYIAGAAVYFMADAINYLGLAISEGLAAGIANGITLVTDAVSGLAGGIVDTICDILGIHSPSTVGMNIGQFFGEGVSIGLDNSSSGVASSAAGLGSAGSDSFMNSISGGIDLSSIDMGSLDTNSLNSMLSGAGKSGGSNFMSGLSDSINIDSLTSGFDFSSMSSMFGNAGSDMGSVFGSGFSSSFSENGMGINISEMMTSIEGHDQDFYNAGKGSVDSYAAGIAEEGYICSENMGAIVSTVLATIRNQYFNWGLAGEFLVEGFASGITVSTWKAAAAASAMASAALEAARAALRINSPSKVFRDIGKSVPEGFAMGIDKLGYVVKDSASSMASTAIDGTKRAIARIAEAIDADIDSQPTIRPVMDLSAVAEGANSISSMLSMTPSMEMMTNVGTISSMMNSRQNVGNGEVLSALKDLKSSLSGRTGDTYSINGITYDDGSNISEAVKTLVRAARIERRV